MSKDNEGATVLNINDPNLVQTCISCRKNKPLTKFRAATEIDVITNKSYTIYGIMCWECKQEIEND